MPDTLKTDDHIQTAIPAQDASELIDDLCQRLTELEAETRTQDRAAALQTQIKSQKAARTAMVDLARSNSILAWGPVIVSGIVAMGFFVTLTFLIFGGFDHSASETNELVFQVINIAVGALTAAFATVVSFWLGSSDGSRRKDLVAFHTQAELAEKTQAETRDPVVSHQEMWGAGPFTDPTPQAVKDPAQFQRCFEIVLSHEGGVADLPGQPQLASNMGISQSTLAAWRSAPVAAADLLDLTQTEAAEIYRANYWNALNCDHLPRGVDLVAFDCAAVHGVGRAAKLLQRVVHVAEDGQIGQITLGAVMAYPPEQLLQAYTEARRSWGKNLTHGSGGLNKLRIRRIDAIHRQARAML